MCHMHFSYDYGTTSFAPKSDWTNFADSISIPSSPDDLRPVSLINVPTSSANYYHLLWSGGGQIAWKNTASSTRSDIGEISFTVSWKRR